MSHSEAEEQTQPGMCKMHAHHSHHSVSAENCSGTTGRKKLIKVSVLLHGTILRTSASLVRFPIGIFLKGEADRCHSAPDNHSPASTRPTPMSWLCVGTMRMGRGPCRAGMVAPVISRDPKRGQHRGGATVWDLWSPSESQMDPSLCTLESARSCWDSGCIHPLPDTYNITAWKATQEKQN